MGTLAFLSSEKVQAALAAPDTRTMKWSELAVCTVYAITVVKKVKGKFGVSFVGDLETQDGTQYKAWVPQRLADDLQGRELPVFVLHKGLKQSVKDKSR